jgi:putative pyrroloquinoline-quinone binding quinoprotein
MWLCQYNPALRESFALRFNPDRLRVELCCWTQNGRDGLSSPAHTEHDVLPLYVRSSRHSRASRWASGGIVAVTLFLSACGRVDEKELGASDEVRCGALNAAAQVSVALPNSHLLRLDGASIQNFSPSGERAWSAEIPQYEPLVADISVAPNSTVYVRNKAEVLALASDGKWLWQFAEPIQGIVNASYQPAAMTDSGVVLRVGARGYRAYSHTGTLRWTVDIDLKGEPRERPVVLQNGTIIVRGADALVALSPIDGNVQWTRSGG